MEKVPITGWVVSVASGILSCILLHEHLLYELGCLFGWWISMLISAIVFMLFLKLFYTLAENRFFTRGNEFLWEYKVKAWVLDVKAWVLDVKEWIRDIKRKINSVFKTTYKFK